MRSFLSPGRRTRHRERFESKFQRRTGRGGRNAIRFRRNRELLAREITTLLLWSAIAVMLAILGKTLAEVARVHLADRAFAVRASLPGAAVIACAACTWRARRSLLEFLDIRREQTELVARLKRDLADLEGES